MSAMTDAKADRLLEEGKVHKVDDEQPRLFHVDATGGGYYRVVIGHHTSWCNCPAGQRASCAATCSHATACRRLFEAEHGGTSEFAGPGVRA